MIQFQFGKNDAGYPLGVITMQEQADPLKLLRGLKQCFPELWAQVNLEIMVPTGANGVNRIFNADGKADANS